MRDSGNQTESNNRNQLQGVFLGEVYGFGLGANDKLDGSLLRCAMGHVSCIKGEEIGGIPFHLQAASPKIIMQLLSLSIVPVFCKVFCNHRHLLKN